MTSMENQIVAGPHSDMLPLLVRDPALRGCRHRNSLDHDGEIHPDLNN
jgi:hypothetical protein